MNTHTKKIILQAWASIKIITVHGGGRASIRGYKEEKSLKLQFIGKGRHLEMLVS